MKSLFFRMFLAFCGAAAVVVGAVVIGYAWTNPDQLPFAWPRVGRGAIVNAGRLAVSMYERGGATELGAYLESLEQDTGMRGALFDSYRRKLAGAGAGMYIPRDLPAQPDGQLVVHILGRVAALRVRGASGAAYSFVAIVPRRTGSLFWSRTFVVLFLVTGALLCYLLARHVTAPVEQLRAATLRFSTGELAARVTAPEVLERTDEIGGLARDFNRMAARIESLMKAQQRLIADVSHELRSPVTRLSLALGLMRRQNEHPAGASVARIEREVERLSALITQLLMLSRLEFLEHRPPMELLDLSAVLREVASDAGFEAASADRSVQLVKCEPVSMRGARDLIRSAIDNVVRNAVKYTCPNTQVVIRLERANGNGRANLVVADRGPGVPPDAIEHMFEPFYRVDEARDRRSGGAGLGLAIARQVVSLHGGSIAAANREGGGLEVRISLPVEPFG